MKVKKNIKYLKSSNKLLDSHRFKIKYEKKLNNFERENERFDFTNEWNNLGYGRIENNGSRFSIANPELKSTEFDEVLAYVQDANEVNQCVFAGIKNGKDGHSTLIINRENGVNDGIDKWLEEDFLTNYQIEKYGSQPILSEIPYGYDGACTMRIDCDEDIASGRKLFEVYQKNNIPFSLAIKTSLNLEGENKKFILDVISQGGSVVSHSHSHHCDWGGSKQSAFKEASQAKERLKMILPKGYNFDYVVSPFHQNSRTAIQGLVQAGIKGFVGGIIHNDPEYLQGRAGFVSTGEPIITHSQQCMLHGECYKKTGLDVYKQSFLNHLKSNTFFGFLDHPFSSYQYGWDSEEQRNRVHDDFLKYINKENNIWSASLIDALNFLWVKSNTKVWIEKDELRVKLPKHNFKSPELKVFWNQKTFKFSSMENV
jgi:hypothetical protein